MGPDKIRSLTLNGHLFGIYSLGRELLSKKVISGRLLVETSGTSVFGMLAVPWLVVGQGLGFSDRWSLPTGKFFLAQNSPKNQLAEKLGGPLFGNEGSFTHPQYTKCTRLRDPHSRPGRLQPEKPGNSQLLRLLLDQPVNLVPQACLVKGYLDLEGLEGFCNKKLVGAAGG